MMKGQDIIIMLLVRLRADQPWTYEALSKGTGLSTSQCHLALKRLRASGLLSGNSSAAWHVPAENCNEFLIHGFKYLFPAKIGAVARGIPTAHSAPLVAKNFKEGDGSGSAYVWPDPEGTVKGNSLNPIHPCQLRFAPAKQPAASLKGRDVYEILVLLDLLRMGRARERKWAAGEIMKRIHDG